MTVNVNAGPLTIPFTKCCQAKFLFILGKLVGFRGTEDGLPYGYGNGDGQECVSFTKWSDPGRILALTLCRCSQQIQGGL